MTTTGKKLDRKPPTILEEPAKPAPVLDDDGLGPTNEDEDDPGLPTDKRTGSVEQLVTRDEQSAHGTALRLWTKIQAKGSTRCQLVACSFPTTESDPSVIRV